MKQKLLMMRAFVLGTVVLSMTSCGIDMPKEVNTSFETMTVEKQDITVLTAQESLLSAQLSEAMNMYSAAQAVIALYIALGGGTK